MLNNKRLRVPTVKDNNHRTKHLELRKASIHPISPQVEFSIGPKFQCRESWSQGDWPPEIFLTLSFGFEHSPDIMIAIASWKF